LTPHKTLDRFNRPVERLKIAALAASEQLIGARILDEALCVLSSYRYDERIRRDCLFC
jgi:hypothetical protein